MTPNEYNRNVLAAFTLCKGVVSKAHKTLVCEFTAPSELAPPLVENRNRHTHEINSLSEY